MTGEYLRISTDDGRTTREMRDNATTDSYITKLSHSHAVRVYFDTGEWYTIDCGSYSTPRGLNNDGKAMLKVIDIL